MNKLYTIGGGLLRSAIQKERRQGTNIALVSLFEFNRLQERGSEV